VHKLKGGVFEGDRDRGAGENITGERVSAIGYWPHELSIANGIAGAR
jgi:hypothetical protein